jgi:hypothetical protein
VTATISELELIQHLDFDPDHECDGDGCENKAAWLSTMTCCGRSLLLCESCNHNIIQFVKDHCSAVGGSVYCLGCNHHMYSLEEFEEVRTLERL